MSKWLSHEMVSFTNSRTLSQVHVIFTILTYLRMIGIVQWAKFELEIKGFEFLNLIELSFSVNYYFLIQFEPNSQILNIILNWWKPCWLTPWKSNSHNISIFTSAIYMQVSILFIIVKIVYKKKVFSSLGNSLSLHLTHPYISAAWRVNQDITI